MSLRIVLRLLWIPWFSATIAFSSSLISLMLGTNILFVRGLDCSCVLQPVLLNALVVVANANYHTLRVSNAFKEFWGYPLGILFVAFGWGPVSVEIKLGLVARWFDLPIALGNRACVPSVVLSGGPAFQLWFILTQTGRCCYRRQSISEWPWNRVSQAYCVPSTWFTPAAAWSTYITDGCTLQRRR